MSYNLLNRDPHIEDQNFLHINRLPARATVIPSDKRFTYYRNKEDSSLIRSLNGDYKFLYLKADFEKEFYRTDYDDSAWDIIDVPSMWQFRGYGKPSYPNIRYPFPFDPPYIRKENPVGYYRRSFNVHSPSGKTLLHFSGVDNAFYVYLNGNLVGFSKGSRFPAEFDVTPYIVKGENLLAVKVFTYSDASYLENQDMLLANGIFRDVYLIETDKNTLWDYRVSSEYDSISVDLKIDVEDSCKVRITLDDESVLYDAKSELTHTFKLENPRLWNAEEPNLYDLSIELIKDNSVLEIHSKRVGIMHTRVSGNKLLVNEKPIYIKGVNRHENNAKNGRAITVSEIENDLKLIKENNLNAIRMAHYLNNPATYEIATELGIYVMDECDLETHGAYIANGDQGYLSKSPEWLSAYVDRTVRMLEVNKNETCIFIRSMGNEHGLGENLNKCVDLVREFDATKEVIITQERAGGYENYTHFRIIAYYPMSRTAEYQPDGYPVLALEYAHAMGNSPGTLSDYWDYNYTHEHFIGGFVWEFRSHGFYCEDKDGKVFYKYGGDFDDDYHWSNFSMDGFCMSDGTPKPSWRELGAVSFAAYTTMSDGTVVIKNTNDFKTLSYLSGLWDITEDGKCVKSGVFNIPTVLPHESFLAEDICTAPDQYRPGARYHLNVRYFLGEKEVHSKQFELENPIAPEKYVSGEGSLTASVSDYVLTVSGKDFSVSFDKGMLSRYERLGDIILDAPIRLNMFRAPTDNDGITRADEMRRWVEVWERALIDKMYFGVHSVDLVENDDKFTLHVSGKYTADSTYSGFIIKISYDIYPSGIIALSVRGEPFGQLPEALPRIGVVIPVKKDYNRVKWLGAGPFENYSDMRSAAPVSLYEKNIEKMNIIYDFPQETGNREDVSYVTLSAKNKHPLSISGQRTFSFSYHSFSLDTLTRAWYKNEVTEDPEYNYLYVDYKMRGLGSRSCGPDPEEKYELHPHSFSFAFVFTSDDDNKALDIARTDFGIKTCALSDTYVPERITRIRSVLDCDI